jgi:hypothetical protein
MSNRLETAVLHREGIRTGWPGRRRKSGRTERFTLDFIIDGVSLHALLCSGLDLCGLFSSKGDCAFRSGSNAYFLRELTGVPGEVRRVSLFICPECGNLGCGAIQMDLACDSEDVVWSRFGYENGYDDTMSDFASFTTVGPYRFHKSDYEAFLLETSRG